jgi:hypothetical protein
LRQRYDLAAARREMALAGHPNGIAEEVTLWVGEGETGSIYGDLIQADLRRIGIRVRQRPAASSRSGDTAEGLNLPPEPQAHERTAQVDVVAAHRRDERLVLPPELKLHGPDEVPDAAAQSHETGAPDETARDVEGEHPGLAREGVEPEAALEAKLAPRSSTQWRSPPKKRSRTSALSATATASR